jgi:hypothetical protein
MSAQQYQIARLLKRLGFQLIKTGKAFKVSDRAGRMAAGSKPTMTLAESSGSAITSSRNRRGDRV